MAVEEAPVFVTRVASSNVSALSYTSTDGATITYSSGGIPQFTVVVEDTSSAKFGDVTTPSGSNVKVLGVSQDAPAVGPGQPVRVCVRGACKAIAGGAVTYGDTLMVGGTNGRVVTATAAQTDWVIGRAMEAAVANGDIITVMVNPSDGKVTMP